MKKSRYSIILVSALLFLSACAQTENVKLKLRIPSKEGINLSAYEDILVTKFLEIDEVKGFRNH